MRYTAAALGCGAPCVTPLPHWGAALPALHRCRTGLRRSLRYSAAALGCGAPCVTPLPHWVAALPALLRCRTGVRRSLRYTAAALGCDAPWIQPAHCHKFLSRYSFGTRGKKSEKRTNSYCSRLVSKQKGYPYG
ncbi:hypothetical protein JCM31598_12940 [Desulfonatronum parangueonense]